MICQTFAYYFRVVFYNKCFILKKQNDTELQNMLIDTHCHINNLVKEKFDISLAESEIRQARLIIDEAKKDNVETIINVGTSYIESENCFKLSAQYKNVYTSVGIHPTDCLSASLKDLENMKAWFLEKNGEKIVAIGECGLDFYHPGFNKQKQYDFFKKQIEMALEFDCALIVHSRNAYDETLKILEEYKNELSRVVIHCFSYDQSFADQIIDWKFLLGIGATITYPKNESLRNIVKNIFLTSFVLETDAPFLPPQIIRGQKNHPKYIRHIAEFIAQLRNISLEEVADATTKNAQKLFNI